MTEGEGEGRRKEKERERETGRCHVAESADGSWGHKQRNEGRNEKKQGNGSLLGPPEGKAPRQHLDLGASDHWKKLPPLQSFTECW